MKFAIRNSVQLMHAVCWLPWCAARYIDNAELSEDNNWQMVDVIYDACKNKGGMFIAAINLYLTMIADEAHLLLTIGSCGMALRDRSHGTARRSG
jgi:hypothetical protein